MKTGHLADSVRAPRVEWRVLRLRRLANLSEHLARSCEVKSALRLEFAQGSQDVMSSIDVGFHRRKAVCETFRNKTLSRQVIALVKALMAEDLKYARIASDIGWVKHQPVAKVDDPPQPPFGFFQCHPTHDAVHFVSQIDQILGQITAVLARDAGDES